MSGLALAMPSRVSWAWLSEPMSPTAAKVRVSAWGETDGGGRPPGPDGAVASWSGSPALTRRGFDPRGPSSCKTTADASDAAIINVQITAITLAPIAGEDTGGPG